MLLELLMAKAKKDHDTTYESASEFFVVKSSCKKVQIATGNQNAVP